MTASARAIAEAEALGDTSQRNAALIVSNTDAMKAAITLADPLDDKAILAMHAALVHHSDPVSAGRWRTEQVWIGGGTSAPAGASPRNELSVGSRKVGASRKGGRRMKILVATKLTQGTRSNDYNYCVPGELVWVQEPCGRDRRDPDGGCGCGRGFAGVASHRATTTAQVVEVDFTRAELIAAMQTSLADGGWPQDWAAEVVDDNLTIASAFPAGTVIERRLDGFQARAA